METPPAKPPRTFQRQQMSSIVNPSAPYPPPLHPFSSQSSSPSNLRQQQQPIRIAQPPPPSEMMMQPSRSTHHLSPLHGGTPSKQQYQQCYSYGSYTPYRQAANGHPHYLLSRHQGPSAASTSTPVLGSCHRRSSIGSEHHPSLSTTFPCSGPRYNEPVNSQRGQTDSGGSPAFSSRSSTGFTRQPNSTPQLPSHSLNMSVGQPHKGSRQVLSELDYNKLTQLAMQQQRQIFVNECELRDRRQLAESTRALGNRSSHASNGQPSSRQPTTTSTGAKLRELKESIAQDERELARLSGTKNEVQQLQEHNHLQRQEVANLENVYVREGMQLRQAIERVDTLKRQLDLLYQRRASAASAAIAQQRMINAGQGHKMLDAARQPNGSGPGSSNMQPQSRPQASVVPLQLSSQHAVTAAENGEEVDSRSKNTRLYAGIPLRGSLAPMGSRQQHPYQQQTAHSSSSGRGGVDRFVQPRSDTLSAIKRRSWALAEGQSVPATMMARRGAEILREGSLNSEGNVWRYLIEEQRRGRTNISLADLASELRLHSGSQGAAATDPKPTAFEASTTTSATCSNESRTARVLDARGCPEKPRPKPIIGPPADELDYPLALLTANGKPAAKQHEDTSEGRCNGGGQALHASGNASLDKRSDNEVAVELRPTPELVAPPSNGAARAKVIVHIAPSEAEVCEEEEKEGNKAIAENGPSVGEEEEDFEVLNAEVFADLRQQMSPPQQEETISEEATAIALRCEDGAQERAFLTEEGANERSEATGEQQGKGLAEEEEEVVAGKSASVESKSESEEAEAQQPAEDEILSEEWAGEERVGKGQEKEEVEEEEKEEDTILPAESRHLHLLLGDAGTIVLNVTDLELHSDDENESEPLFDVMCSAAEVPLKGILSTTSGRQRGKRVAFDKTLLFVDAAYEGEYELLVQLANEIPNISVANGEGITALHNAICAGNHEIVKFLIDYQADVNALDTDGWSPLHCAASCIDYTMIKQLVENGACLFATTFNGESMASRFDEAEETGGDCELARSYVEVAQQSMGFVNEAKVYAAFAFEAEREDELSFEEGAELKVLCRFDIEAGESVGEGKEGSPPTSNDAKFWWLCEDLSTGERGLVPRNWLSLYPSLRQRESLNFEYFELSLPHEAREDGEENSANAAVEEEEQPPSSEEEAPSPIEWTSTALISSAAEKRGEPDATSSIPLIGKELSTYA